MVFNTTTNKKIYLSLESVYFLIYKKLNWVDFFIKNSTQNQSYVLENKTKKYLF